MSTHPQKTLFGIFLVVSFIATPLFAQISYNNFNDVSALALNGAAAQANNNGNEVLRITPDQTFHVSGTAWFMTQQQTVNQGFTTAFTYQITHESAGTADGFAFVIQNSMGDGFGTSALGGSGGAIGYGAPDPGDTGVPIPNSLAVEFDTYQNSWDPNNNHIAVQSCGTDPNTQNHNATCPSGNPAELGIVSDLGGIQLADGNVHTVVIDYDPGTLRVFVDNFGVPLLVVPVFLDKLLNLNDGAAWAGFSGGSGAVSENHDIFTWTFTPATQQTTIQQTLTPNVQNAITNYVFGSYNHKLQYSLANAGDSVAVTAIPIDQKTFHDSRLVGTIFSNAQCVLYDGTGGLCVEFEVNCSQQQGSDCTGLNYDLFNNFNTNQTINGACVLKAPIDTNNWQNIIETFTQTRQDPGTHSGSKGFSDFIVAQNCTAPPTVSITSPANGSTVLVNTNVTINFSCAPDPNAPLVTITSCTGLLNNTTPVTNGQVVSFSQVGTDTLTVTAVDSVQDTSMGTSTFTVGQAPAFTSPNGTTFQVGVLGNFTVTTTGFPAATITETGSLPNGVMLVSHGDGTASLSGTPAAGTGGQYNITLMATNSAGSAQQSFTLTVLQLPAITSPNNATFQLGVQGQFTVTATGYPLPSLTESGSLPGGVGFVDNGNGTGTLSGKPTTSGTFNIVFTATNTAGNAMQNFVLTVNGPQVTISPSSINFGNVPLFHFVWKNVTIQNTGNTTLQIKKIYDTLGQGADADDYFVLSLCPPTLAIGKSCSVIQYFWADDLGTASATLNVADNAPGSPQQVPLTATVVKK